LTGSKIAAPVAGFASISLPGRKQALSKVDDFVARYAAAWNEADAERRKAAVSEVWAEDGVYANSSEEYRGHEQIEKAVREAYDDFIAKGFAFTVHEHREHHGCVRIVWHMVPQGGGAAAAIGTEFIVLDDSGRARTDHQFIEMSPA